MVPPLAGEPFLGSLPLSSVPSTQCAVPVEDDACLATVLFFALAPVALMTTAAIAARAATKPVSRQKRPAPERDAGLNLMYSFPSLMLLGMKWTPSATAF